MKNKRFLLLIIFIAMTIVVGKVDKNLRYKIGLLDYYKHNGEFTDIEREKSKEKPIIIGGYNLAPLMYTNKFNNYNTGIMVDHLSQISIEIGGDIHMKVDNKCNLEKILMNEEVDGIVMEIDKNDKNVYDNISFTQGLCNISKQIVVKRDYGINDIQGLNNKRIAMMETGRNRDVLKEYLEKNINVEIIEVENIYQCFALLDREIVDSFIGNDMEINHFLNVTNKSGNYKLLDKKIMEKEIVIGVRESDEILLNLLNKGILRIKRKNLIAQTQYKWLGHSNNLIFDIEAVDRLYQLLLMILMIILFFSYWNFAITKKVNLRTKELFESKEELRLIIDKISSGIMVISNSGDILECNESIVSIVKMKRKNIIGKNYTEIKTLNYLLNQQNFNSTFKYLNKYYYMSKQKITENKCMIVIEDYTDKYLEEKRKRQESKMITMGKLSAGLAHEIRNPLGLIKSYSYILSKQKLDGIYEHAISVINESVIRINGLIENLLRFSKLSSDNIEWVNINEIISNIIETFNIRLKKENILMVVKYLDWDDRFVEINEEVLSMAVINLISNAIDSFIGYKDTRKIININMDKIDSMLIIKIRDNGVGIDKNKIDEVFDPFFSTKKEGIGLGLYIVSTEIYNNNGEISIDSEIKEGTQFIIKLPINNGVIQ